IAHLSTGSRIPLFPRSSLSKGRSMTAIADRSNPSRTFEPATAAAIVVTIIAWASAFPAIRAGLAAFGPVELGAARLAIAPVPAAASLIVTRLALPRWSEAWRFFVGGLFFVALYTTLLNLGEQTVSAGPASFIINVNPIITAVFAMMVLGERFSRRAWSGTAL